MAISGSTGLLGLLGDPVAHSLSPAMHNAALTVLGLDWVYLPFPCRGKDLGAVLAGLGSVGVRGLNVTIPHKQAVMAHVSAVDPLAAQIGAVNTLVRVEERGEWHWQGRNTDIEGFCYPLVTRWQRDWGQVTALVLGSGGAARAAIQGCLHLGIPKVVVVARDPAKGATLANSPVNSQIQVCDWSDLQAHLGEASLIINSTPVGMKGQDQHRSPLSSEQLAQAPPGSLVYDLIYTPNPTVLLQQAGSLGYDTQDGLEMLVRQGAAALAAWVGLEGIPDEAVNAMRGAAMGHLGLR